MKGIAKLLNMTIEGLVLLADNASSCKSQCVIAECSNASQGRTNRGCQKGIFQFWIFITAAVVTLYTNIFRGVCFQGAAKRAKAEQTEAARKEIAELMAKAKADMDKEDKTDEAEAAKSQADDLQKEVRHLTPCMQVWPFSRRCGTLTQFVHKSLAKAQVNYC